MWATSDEFICQKPFSMQWVTSTKQNATDLGIVRFWMAQKRKLECSHVGCLYIASLWKAPRIPLLSQKLLTRFFQFSTLFLMSSSQFFGLASSLKRLCDINAITRGPKGQVVLRFSVVRLHCTTTVVMKHLREASVSRNRWIVSVTVTWDGSHFQFISQIF